MAEQSYPSGKLIVDPQRLSHGFRARLDTLIREARQVAPIDAVATFSQKVRADQSPEQQLHNANTHVYYMPFLAVGDVVRAFDEYNRVIRDTAAATGALLIDGENDIPADDLHFRDSIHFTDRGRVAMAQSVIRALGASPKVRELADAVSRRQRVQLLGMR